MKCPICNVEIPDDSKFCNKCGAKIEAQGKACPNEKCLRAGLPQEALYCPDCGFAIDAGKGNCVHTLVNTLNQLHSQRQSDVTGKSFVENVLGIKIEMVWVKGGTFQIGPDNFKRSVTVSNFHIGKCVITEEQYEMVTGNKSGFKGSNFPAVINFESCYKFIKKLNNITGKDFRLPTEAEWEYAARGGDKSRRYKYAGSSNLDEVGWYYSNCGDKYLDEGYFNPKNSKKNKNGLHEVGKKESNELGIHDMSGNVWEWCGDWYGGTYPTDLNQIDPKGPGNGLYRVIRGGSWEHKSAYCTVEYRNYASPENDRYIGFRLALSPQCK